MAEVRIAVHDTLSDLVAWAQRAQGLDQRLDAVARKAARDGNRLAKGFARRSAGRHGRRYPSSFTIGKLGPGTYVYGPEAGRPQGGMSFEFGSRKQKPHLDLAKSADQIREQLVAGVRDAISEALR